MKTRIIYTNFWKDNYISACSAKEKLAFIYLITNDSVSICGIYQLPDKYIKMDLGLTSEEWDQVKEKFVKDRKFYFENGWIKVMNWQKYNKYAGIKNKNAIKKELSLVPVNLAEYRYSIDTVSATADTLNNQNHKSKSESKSELLESVKTFSEVEDPINRLIGLFEPVNPSYKRLYPKVGQRQALERLINEHGLAKTEWAVKSLPHVVGQQFAPTITTPYELEAKLGALIAYLRREKGTSDKFAVTKV